MQNRGECKVDDFREWLSDNLRYILLGLAVLLVIIIVVCIFRLIGGSSSNNNNKKKNTVVENVDDTASTEQMIPSSTSSAPAAAEGLTVNEESLLALMKKYYNAVTSEDVAVLGTIVVPWNDTVRDEILALNQDFKSFENITTYSKDGPVDNSYLVYVYCECRVDGVDVGIPTLLNPVVVITEDSGDLKISSDKSQYSDFINESNKSSEVQSLIADVNKKYAELKASNAQVKAYSEGGSTGSDEASTESQSAEGGSSDTSAQGKSAVATDGVNVRSEASTNGAVLGTLYPGQEVTVVSQEGSWTHITYVNSGTGGTIEGYVSSDYLSVGAA